MVFTQLSRLVPKGRRGDFNAEILGAPRAESGCYFPASALDFTFGVGRRYRSVPPASAVFVGIDPASHGKSSMGLSAVMDLRDGRVLLLGVASVCVQRCEIREVCTVPSSAFWCVYSRGCFWEKKLGGFGRGVVVRRCFC